MAVYVTSDLHGYPIDTFRQFLTDSGFCENDTLYILGDVVDRGNDGVRYLWWAATTANVKLIMGNHEKMMMDCEFALEHIKEDTLHLVDYEKRQLISHWISNGGTPTLSVISQLLAIASDRVKQVYDFLHTLPLYAELHVNGRDFVLVHGGLGDFSAERPLSDYLPFDLLWCRPSLNKRYFENKTVILGHTPTQYYGSQYSGRMLNTDTWLDIDTGAAYGGSPMLLRLDDMKEFYLSKAE